MCAELRRSHLESDKARSSGDERRDDLMPGAVGPRVAGVPQVAPSKHDGRSKREGRSRDPEHEPNLGSREEVLGSLLEDQDVKGCTSEDEGHDQRDAHQELSQDADHGEEVPRQRQGQHPTRDVLATEREAAHAENQARCGRSPAVEVAVPHDRQEVGRRDEGEGQSREPVAP